MKVSKPILALVSVCAVTVAVWAYALHHHYESNVFQFQLGDGQGTMTRVELVTHSSPIPGAHTYTLFQPDVGGYVYGPSGTSLAWSIGSEIQSGPEGITATGQRCGAALRFDKDNNLTGIGMVTEDGIGPVQTIPPVHIVPERVYRLADYRHINGAYCTFRTTKDAITNVEFAVWISPYRYGEYHVN